MYPAPLFHISKYATDPTKYLWGLRVTTYKIELFIVQ